MGPRVAVLHHRRSFFPPDLREAIGDAAELVWVLPAGGEDDLLGRRLLDRLGLVVDIPPDDLDAAAAVLAEHRIEGIVTFVDDNLVLTAELAARLQLPYHTPELARVLVSKARQREALAAAGVPGPGFWRLPSGLAAPEVAAFASQLPYPAVLKPVCGSGSRGIVALTEQSDLPALYDPAVDYLVEEHLDDDPSCDCRFASYLSVETVVSRGITDHVAITGRFPLAAPFRETGNFIPAAINNGTPRQLCELTDRAIAALGITTGVLHTEIKLTPAGPRLIELNGRLGGRPPFVLRSVSDVNLFQAACEVALGAPVQRRGLVRCNGVGYWRLLQPPCTARRVAHVTGLPELAQEPGVDSVRLSRGPGDELDLCEGTDGKVLTVCGRVGDLAELSSVIERIERTVSIDYVF